MAQQAEGQILFTAPGQAEYRTLDLPFTPLGPQEVAGHTLVSLISTGTELAGYQGLGQWGAFPLTPGYAAVFTVEETGQEVSDLRPGDLAFCMGRHRSYQRMPRAEVIPLPARLSPEEATFARLMSVTLTTLITTKARPPDKVLVTGLGLVGHLAAKNFARCGYTVYACDPDPARRAIAQANGISHVLPAVPLDDPALAKQVALALECSGHEQALLDACNIVRKRGEVVQVAAAWRRQTDIPAHEIQRAVFFNYVDYRSGWEWELPHHAGDFRPHSIFGNLTTALQWLAEGSVRVAGLYAMAEPQDAQQVYQKLLHGQVERLGVVLDWR
ncbi:MAG TPA: zinc-binding alcohol dehydrogenase [Caldilineaceae bacterium]|nr:zinc-binding alcohol dehydrogenase [Caldilineaceae bacterium]